MKQENRPPRILYWKWDDSHIDSGSYRAGIDDLCERSCFDTVFICTHWCRDGLSTKKTHDAVLDACRRKKESIPSHFASAYFLFAPIRSNRVVPSLEI